MTVTTSYGSADDPRPLPDPTAIVPLVRPQQMRPWGHYISLELGARHQVKRLVVKPGESLSLQKHYHRAEVWVVITGTAEVTCDDVVKLVYEAESIHLPVGCTHRLANPGRIDLELIEVQTGSYLGEDDICRLEDVYGRPRSDRRTSENR